MPASSVEMTSSAGGGEEADAGAVRRMETLSKQERDELERRRRPTCFCLTSLADRSLTSTKTKPEAMKWMLDPSSEFIIKWDKLMVVLLLFVSFVTPFEVAFLPTKPDALFVINRIVDLGFIIDMVFQFFLPYFDADDLVFVWNRDLIALNYATGWFPIDIVSVLPYDFFGGDPFNVPEVAEGDTEGSNSLKVFRMVRLLKLMRLARLQRKLSHMWWMQFLNPAARKMITLMMTYQATFRNNSCCILSFSE